MRKLKLQMQISLDGFVTADYGGTNFNWDEEVKSFSTDNLKNVDTILLGKNTAEDFLFWRDVANDPNNVDRAFGKLLTDTPKVIFSSSLATSAWDNAAIVKDDIVKGIETLKRKPGNDMIVYGGYSFVSSLIENGLIDEYYLLLNPVAVGSGQPIFHSIKNNLQLRLEESKRFACGTVLLHYRNDNNLISKT